MIPAARMEAGKERRLPLSGAAMGILEKQKAIRSNDYVLAGRGSGPAGKDTLGAMRKRLGHHLVLPLAGTELHHLDRVPLGVAANPATKRRLIGAISTKEAKGWRR